MSLERAILSIPILYGGEYLAEVLAIDAGMFRMSEHREIYQALRDLGDEDGEVDYTRLKGRLKGRAHDELVVMLAESQAAPSLIQQYIADLKQHRADEKLRLLAGRAHRGDAGAEELLEVIEEWRESQAVPVVDAVELCDLSTREDEPTVPSGFPSLDEDFLHGGFGEGQLVILAGSTSSGKTAASISMACQAALDGLRVLIFSLEMTAREIARRVVCGMSGVPHYLLRRPMMMSPSQRLAVTEAKEALAASKIAVVDRASLGVGDVLSVSRVQRPSVVIVDYLQLMKSPVRGENRNLQVAAISGGLKRAARELSAPVIALSQLRRIEERRPRLDDLRDSGALEQDADVVLMVYRKDREADEGLLLVEKNRHGPTGSVSLDWDGQTMSFRDPRGKPADPGKLLQVPT